MTPHVIKQGFFSKFLEDISPFCEAIDTHLFRWFKFTLKPPYSIACSKLQLAIWNTSFCTFWVKFGHKGH